MQTHPRLEFSDARQNLGRGLLSDGEGIITFTAGCFAHLNITGISVVPSL